MTASTFLAIDAGGTKTDLLWTQEDGQVLARAQGEGVNIASTPPNVWQRRLERLLRQAQVDCQQVQTVCAGVAGYTLPDRRAQFERMLQQLFPRARLLVLADYAIALEGATGGEAGILVLAGTGSIVCGRDRDGNVLRAGGWGYLLDDEGSGFWIGREALRAALAAAEGWGETTCLHRLLSETLGSTDPGDWLSKLYRAHNPQSLLAGLASLVSQAAEQEDSVAQRILHEAAQHLAERVTQLRRVLPLPEDFPVYIVGGVWNSSLVRQCFEQLLHQRLPSWRGEVRPPRLSPVEGAFLIAQRVTQP
ncbi:MAG: hypothetical protein NZ520_04740 [bacterium]|nr:hypothetical protein [bacterium]